MKIALAIATTGRAELVCAIARHWLSQTRPADRVLVVGATPSDIAGLGEAHPGIEVKLARKGSCAQRNAAFDALSGADIIVFLDDDFVPSRKFLAAVEQFFATHPDAAIVTGSLLADGINSPGISLQEAERIVTAHDQSGAHAVDAWDVNHAYGCNMALRFNLAPQLRFDERLPLYGWQEDRDISRQYAAFGRVMRSEALRGVHMGVKSGRQSGVRLGYSQIANPIYLTGKGSMTPGEAFALSGKNLAMNAVRAFFPEPWADRRGRLIGNLRALADAVRGRLRPERVLDF